MFELGAFLHGKDLQADDCLNCLVVCPVFVGPALVTGHLGLSLLLVAFVCSQVPIIPWAAFFISALAFPCLTLLAFVVLAHCHSIEEVQNQVRNFRIEDSKCYCCSRGHVEADGTEMAICDRRVVYSCIDCWFGSREQFELVVRTRVLSTLLRQLTRNVFSYGRIVQVTCPMWWLFLDLVASQDSGDRARLFLQTGLQGGAYCLMLTPSLVWIMLRMAYRLRKLFVGLYRQLLLSFGLIAAGTLIFSLLFAAERSLAELSYRFFQSQWPSGIAMLTIAGPATFFVWRLPIIGMPSPSDAISQS